MKNALPTNVDYLYRETPFGIWRRFGYENGHAFSEFKSHANFFGVPFFHLTKGKFPETGKRLPAKGVIAVGRVAVGFVAIGQAAFGILAIGQLALGLIFGLGQLSTGVAAIGQAAIGISIGFGQFASGFVAIGQFAIGKYVMAQMGIGQYVWDANSDGSSHVAEEFFKTFFGF